MTLPSIRPILACMLVLTSLVLLELARKGVAITQFEIGRTPVTQYARSDATGPAIVIAHGFAGSQQMMQGYALPLARAGYRVFAFEFLGHGRHPDPMSGDVTVIEGTTQLLMDQTHAVINAVATTDQTVALVGHSMATDILVRVAEDRTDIGPIVLISAFSQVIDKTSPSALLLVTGAWESGLRAFALNAVQMVSPSATEGETVTSGTTIRRAFAAPFSEHVSILQSRTARAEAIAWLDTYYARSSDITILPTGWAILGLLGGLVLLFPTLAQQIPAREHPKTALNLKKLACLGLLPTVITPLVAVPLNFGILPVLVADYLAIHLLVFSVIQLACLRFWRVHFGHVSPAALLLLLAWCALFGLALDRYAANFWPTPERLWIIAAIASGALPYMTADAILAHNLSYPKRAGLRLCLLISLAIAVALDFDSLFFVMMIAPVLVLFYAVFATMGHHTSTRSGPLATGIALGLVLAWALGVSFPLFQA